MAFDQHKNLAIASVTNAPGAAGTTLTVAGGEGARFPAVPFNATVWPATEIPTPVNAEVVRVTAIAADSFTITRSQEGTTARAIVAGDLIAATITAKTITDIESGVNFPLITTPGMGTFVGVRSTGYTPAGAGPGMELSLVGTDGYVSAYDRTAGAYNQLLIAGRNISFNIDGTSRGKMHNSGGFSWGSSTDPGAGNLSVAGELILSGPTSYAIRRSTPDGADNSILQLAGGGAGGAHRGAFFNLFGNEYAGAGGQLSIGAGDAGATGKITFETGASVIRGTIHASGGFSWGGTGDPGAGVFLVGTYGGQSGFITPGGYFQSGILAATATHFGFYNNAGGVGSITSTAAGTQYNTTSDARLKTPLGRHTDPDVLRNTVIHNFVWKSDGTRGRGVFAQEAHAVAPFAVSVGSDEVDDQGRLTKPWGVDYSKYVPDLITGWQDHETLLIDTRLRVNEIYDELRALKHAPPVYTKPLGRTTGVLRRFATAIRALFGRVPSWV